MKKVAIVYDRVNKWGGAERVLLALHKIFPDAPLYTSVYSPIGAPWAEAFPKVIPSFLQKFPFSKYHQLYAPLMPFVFESFNFDKYDLVISVTSESAKGIVTKPGTVHVCYCLTPTRYLWSGYRDYFKNEFLRILSLPLVVYLRFWDKQAAGRPDKFIAISKEVQGRIRKYYGRDSSVVYPPAALSAKKKKTTSEGYFLIVSRLVPYKRVDIAVRAFNRLGLPLKIVGTGSEEGKLRKIAKGNIEFLGSLTDKELVRYYERCRCLIFCGKEDFGLTILEANSFGKPVIAFRAGGALESVVEGKTGIFFDKQNSSSLVQEVLKFGKISFNSNACMQRAREFSYASFRKNFLLEVERVK